MTHKPSVIWEKLRCRPPHYEAQNTEENWRERARESNLETERVLLGQQSSWPTEDQSSNSSASHQTGESFPPRPSQKQSYSCCTHNGLDSSQLTSVWKHCLFNEKKQKNSSSYVLSIYDIRFFISSTFTFVFTPGCLWGAKYFKCLLNLKGGNFLNSWCILKQTSCTTVRG